MRDRDEQIRELHREGLSLREIGVRFGLSYQGVWRVVNRDRVLRRERERRAQPLPVVRRKVGQTLPWEGVSE